MMQPYKSVAVGQSLRHAGRGFWAVLEREKNMKWHLAALVAALVLGVAVGLSSTELAAIVLVSALVISLECINSALEYIEDIVEPNHHESVRRSKDMAAAAVLVAALAAVVVAVLLFGRVLLA